jgi:hypothetical protein
MSKRYRFHVMLGEKRSTISLPKHLLVLLALKRGYDLQNRKTLHTQIREWCQKTLIDWDYNESAIHFSQFLQQKIVEELLDKKLSEKYDSLFLNNEYDKIGF